MALPRDKAPEEVRFLLNRRGLTFADVDRASGLIPGTARKTVQHPYAAGETAIASVLGIDARDIWPSRYAADGTRLRPQPKKNYTDRATLGHRQKRKAA